MAKNPDRGSTGEEIEGKSSNDVLKRLVKQAKEDPKFFHDLIFNTERTLAKLDYVDRKSKSSLLWFTPEEVIGMIIGRMRSIERAPITFIRCDLTCDSSCGITCTAASCSHTCGTFAKSCGEAVTCGVSCGYTVAHQ